MNKRIPPSLLLISILINCALFGAETPYAILKGKKADYAGDTLVFLGYSNMISFHEEELGRCVVDDSGFFECRIPLIETRHVFNYLGVYNCYLYAQPGMIYNIRLPGKREKSLQDLMNPYFEETSIHLSVKIEGNAYGKSIPAPEDELNFAIRAFNDSFYPYYYKFVINAYGDQVNRRELEKAEEELLLPFDSVAGSYLRAYINYRMGLLEHYGRQVPNHKIIEDYFLEKPVLYRNPAYMELFNQVFKDYFIAFSEEHPSLRFPIVLNREKDYSRASRILAVEASLENDSLRELVVLKGLYDGYYDGKNLPSSMIQLLDSLKSSTRIEMHKQVVQDILSEFNRLSPGYQPPDFALYQSDSTIVRLSDFRGSYVYLNFCNSFGYYCVREYEYLRILHQRLKDRLSIVTVLVDDSFENMEQLVKSNNYPWTFLHFSNQPEVLENFDIRAYPSYFLIGPDGKLILSPAPSPLEDFESTFLQIYSREETPPGKDD